MLTLKDINILYPICFTTNKLQESWDRHKGQTNKQIERSNRHKGHTDFDQQARHLLVIFEDLEVTLKTETAFSNRATKAAPKPTVPYLLL